MADILTEDSINIELAEDIILAEIKEETIDITLENSYIYYGAGSGDMQTSVYDINKNGIVDSSEAVIIDNIVAQEDFLAGDLIAFNGYHPSSDDITFRNRVAGIVVQDTSAGYVVKVLAEGKYSNTNWNFTPNTVLFLNVKSISQIAPTIGFIQEIGKAINSSVIYVNIKQSILL